MAALRSLALLSRRILHLILMPTEQCQLRCSYCWQDFEFGRMRPEIVRGVKRWIGTRAPDLDLLAIEWFGGEPLLAGDLVEEIQAYAQNVAARSRTRLTSGITTNGLLLDRCRLEHLVDMGITRYQITLDGPREVHDLYRHSARGLGSFDRVWANLLEAREAARDFEVRLRINVSAENADSLGTFLERCGRAFGSDVRFRVAFHPLHLTNQPRDAILPFMARDDEERVLGDLGRQAAAVGLRVSEGPSAGARPGLACYAAAASSFVVRANGDLAKCTVALRNRRNCVGRLRENGAVELDQRLMSGWLRGALTGREAELKCPAKGWLWELTSASSTRTAPPRSTTPRSKAGSGDCSMAIPKRSSAR